MKLYGIIAFLFALACFFALVNDPRSPLYKDIVSGFMAFSIIGSATVIALRTLDGMIRSFFNDR